MTLNLDMSLFPAFKESIQAKWCPIFLEPIIGSYEKLVVGVVVVSESDFHLEIANRLDKLSCLYGSGADGLVFAIKIATNYLQEDLSLRGLDALSNPSLIVSAISIGEIREAMGENLAEIGKSWLSSLTSLYESETTVQFANDDLSDIVQSTAIDKLPSLIFSYIQQKRVGLGAFFREDIREGRRRTGNNYNVLIDFSGSRLVANFGTLKAGSISKSVNIIKHRLWDLKVNRDEANETFLSRDYEMIVQMPHRDDPQITRRQQTSLRDSFHALEEQADKEELRLRSLSTVEEIGQRIMEAEAA